MIFFDLQLYLFSDWFDVNIFDQLVYKVISTMLSQSVDIKIHSFENL